MAKSQLTQLCEQLAKVRKSAIVSIVLPDEPISPQHVLKIHKFVNGKRCKDLSVILHSSGGDINSTYQIIELLRSHCENMTTTIPLYAKSAATLFVLGSDKIVMGEIAEVGPLDTQIGESEKGGIRYSSALNPFKTLEELQRFSLETLDMTVKLLLTRARLSVEDAIKHGMVFASRISMPLLSQLNAEKVGEYSRALEVGREYGERLLRRYTKLQNKDNILKKFIWGYPSHGYIIDIKELKEIGFNADLPPEDEKPILEKIVECVLNSSQPEIFLVEHKPNKKGGKNE